MIDLLESWLRRGQRRAWQLASGHRIAEVPILDLWDGERHAVYPLSGPDSYESYLWAAIEHFTPGETHA